MASTSAPIRSTQDPGPPLLFALPGRNAAAVVTLPKKKTGSRFKGSDEYTTPPEMVTALEQEFGAFDLDPAATAANAKAPQWFGVDVDGLRQTWFGRVFLNPPYGGPGRPFVLKHWIQKAWASAHDGDVDLIVALLPAWTDTDWWHEFVWNKPNVEVRFHRNRIHFIDPAGHRARPIRASCTVIWRNARAQG